MKSNPIDMAEDVINEQLIEKGSKGMYKAFESLVNAGFSRTEAIELLKTILNRG